MQTLIYTGLIYIDGFCSFHILFITDGYEEAELTIDYSGKNVLDLRDELTRVCKSLRESRSDKEELCYEIKRLKKVVEKKEKEVEDLLVGGYVGQKDRSRIAGTSTKQDTLLVSQFHSSTYKMI